MPQHKSAVKRVRQNSKRRLHNRHYRSKMKTSVKKVLETQNKQEAEKHLNEAISLLDSLSTRGLVPKNTAARKKSRMARHVNSLK